MTKTTARTAIRRIGLAMVWLTTAAASATHGGTDLYRLAWTDDPATTMTVGWRQTGGTFSHLQYRVKDSLGSWNQANTLVQRNYQNTVSGVQDALNNSFVKLTGLTPDTDYEFQICDSGGCSQTYMWFRTAPATGETFSFIAGGDSRRETTGDFSKNDRARRNGFKLVSRIRPLFVLFSGDYMSNGTFEEWLVWLDEWQLTRSSDGRMYPIVPTHGNHENDVLDMVQNLFNIEGPAGNGAHGTYNSLGFGGDMLRIWTLNTELEPGVGYSAFQNQSSQAWNAQTAWFSADLQAHANTTWKVVNYHRPLRPHTSSKAEGLLRYSDWAPLFDQYNIDLAIESDSHMVKYTVPVNMSSAAGSEEGFIAADLGSAEHGTVFVGEGSWGAPKRPIDDAKSWTLVNNSFWQFKHITVSPTNLDVRTVRFENASYPNGVEVDVLELDQTIQDGVPGALPAGLDLWQPFEGDGPLQLPFTAMPTVKADANVVPDDGDAGAPDGALYYNNFSGGFTSATYGDIQLVDLACSDTGTASWYLYNGQKASINGYNPSAANTAENCNDWMILPPQDLSATGAVTLTFDSDYNFGGPELLLWYSSDYNPAIDSDPGSATWHPLSFDLPPGDGYTPGASGPVVVYAGGIPVAERGAVYIAFQYVSTGRLSGDGRIWEVDNVLIVDGEQILAEPAGENFDAGALGSWQAVNVASSNTWAAASVGGRAAARMHNQYAFSNADDWLVSPAYAIDTAAGTADFNFLYYYQGATAQVPASDNFQLLVYPGCPLTGTYTPAMIDPADWTLLHNSFPGSESVWTANATVDLSAYDGQTVCLAFRYRDAGVATARLWAVDDLALGTPPQVVSDTIPAKDIAHLRVATFNALLADRGAGQLVANLAGGNDSQARGIAEIIQRVAPDVILLNEFDYDAAGTAIDTFKTQYLAVSQNGQAPISFPYHYINISNTGVQPESEGEPDCDFNDPAFGCDAGSANDDPEDAFGFGNYPGAFGMAVLSKYPLDTGNIRTFRKFIWQDMPANLIPPGFYSPDELAIFRLSSKSHWDIPVDVNGEILHLLGSHPTPPVFDGSEDRNGRRNHDELRFWEDYVSLTGSDCYIYDDNGIPGCLGYGKRFVIAGDQNADPVNGDSFADAALQYLNNPVVDDSFTPLSSGGAGATSGEMATADFGLRADYVLPSRAGLQIEMNACDTADPALSCGIFWPRVGDPQRALTGSCSGSGPGCASSDHRLVWIDLSVIPDSDNDSVPDDVDNCPATADSTQQDLDRDRLGDVCDPDDDNDGMDDSWEQTYGLDPANPVDAQLDNDNDGKTNLQEFLDGTNPNVVEGYDDEDIPFLPLWAMWLLAAGLGALGMRRHRGSREK